MRLDSSQRLIIELAIIGLGIVLPTVGAIVGVSYTFYDYFTSQSN